MTRLSILKMVMMMSLTDVRVQWLLHACLYVFWFQAFAIFCGLGINNTRMYEQVVKAMARQTVAFEILSYHSSASAEEVNRMKVVIKVFFLRSVHFF